MCFWRHCLFHKVLALRHGHVSLRWFLPSFLLWGRGAASRLAEVQLQPAGGLQFTPEGTTTWEQGRWSAHGQQSRCCPCHGGQQQLSKTRAVIAISCPAICQIKLIPSVGDSWECITTQQTPAHRRILVKEFEPQRVRTHSHGGKSPTRGYPKKRVTQHRAGERGSRGDSLAAPQRSDSSWQSWQSWHSSVRCELCRFNQAAPTGGTSQSLDSEAPNRPGTPA